MSFRSIIQKVKILETLINKLLKSTLDQHSKKSWKLNFVLRDTVTVDLFTHTFLELGSP